MIGRRAWLTALLAATLALPAGAVTAGRGEDFRFGVIGRVVKGEPDEAALRLALREASRASLAFVVVNGIKGSAEPCADALYGRRRELLDDSARPLIVSLTAGDWSECRDARGRPVALERLNRLRELLFGEPQSLGARRIGLTQLSANAKFRDYAENVYWEHGRVLFATVNLPANNNHFRPEAGRNSEFEDRLVANRAWLRRLFVLAQRQQLEGIVLFSDGDVGVERDQKGAPVTDRQDGFASVRREIRTLAQQFPGQVLLADAQGGKPGSATGIAWRDNLGHLGVGPGWVEIRVASARATLRRTPMRRAPLFTVTGGNAPAQPGEPQQR